MRDSIPIIRNDNDFYYELFPRDRMRDLLARTQTEGWQSALAEELARETDEKASDISQLYLDEQRAAFKVLFPGSSRGRILDLGCGSGSTAIALGRWCREVVACDLTYERVAFLAKRVRESGPPGVRVICAGDTRPLPFPDQSFDGVVLNGVLEWSAGMGTRPVREAQIEFLKEVRRILRPGGHLYIGIENRLGYRYFLGEPEDHTGVPYAALVPRWLADLLVRRANGHTYRTYTYSVAGYRRLLRQTGFGEARFYATIPDYRKFDELVSLDDRSLTSAIPWRPIRRSVRLRLERSRWFATSLGIVAGKRKVETSWVNCLAEHVRESLKLTGPVRFLTVRVSGAATAGVNVFVDRDVVVRVPLEPASEVKIQHNFEGLRAAQEFLGALTRVRTPKPLLAGEFDGVAFQAETRLPGRTLDEVAPSARPAAEARMFELLLSLASTKDSETSSDTAETVWRRQVVDCLDHAVRWAKNAEELRLATALTKEATRTNPSDLVLTFSHGDFWWGNILISAPDEPLGLIDWDRWARTQLVTHDFLHLICHRRRLRDSCSWAKAFCDWLGGVGIDAQESRWVKRFADHLGLAPGWSRWAALAYWAREVASHAGTRFDLNPLWVRRNYLDVMPRLHSVIAARG